MKYHKCDADGGHGYLFADEIEICRHCNKKIEVKK